MIKTIITKIGAFIGAIGMGLSVIFYVLMKLAKDERKIEEQKARDLKLDLDAFIEAEKAEKEKREQNAELEKKINSGNTLDSFNACNELLQK